MKIILDNIENSLTKMKKEREESKKQYLDNINIPYREIYLKLFNETSIEKRNEIIKNEITDDYYEQIKAEGYFCPYLISIWDENLPSNHISKETIKWKDEFGEMCIENLFKILDIYNKNHLKVIGNWRGYSFLHQMAEIER